ncbi:hypothetical protein G3R49_18340 [Shewanella sp. WXL01]|uniref:hypothetical protein n=1 Tax=Shewanella sp. WXL01 TaxID=2709721 RepID=UPI00143837BF|nr:hypothetical protein [Shewanella sp. WXL01]NKF52522.1 hypothetical protein [Shewanella sp. WXL01]
MVRLLLAICFIPFSSIAAPTIQSLLAESEVIAPAVVMQQIEQQHKKSTICGFGVEVEDQQLVYKVSMIDLATEQRSRFFVRASDGEVLEHTQERVVLDKIDQAHAVSMLQDKHIAFSKLVAMARKNHQGFLLQAELDHDLSISYLELKLLNQSRKSIVAFDIEKLRPLPLLKWD